MCTVRSRPGKTRTFPDVGVRGPGGGGETQSAQRDVYINFNRRVVYGYFCSHRNISKRSIYITDGSPTIHRRLIFFDLNQKSTRILCTVSVANLTRLRVLRINVQL